MPPHRTELSTNALQEAPSSFEPHVCMMGNVPMPPSTHQPIARCVVSPCSPQPVWIFLPLPSPLYSYMNTPIDISALTICFLSAPFCTETRSSPQGYSSLRWPFLNGGKQPPLGQLIMCTDTFSWHSAGRKDNVTGAQKTGIGDSAKYPTIHKMASHNV